MPYLMSEEEIAEEKRMKAEEALKEEEKSKIAKKNYREFWNKNKK